MKEVMLVNPPSPFLKDQLVMPPLGLMYLSSYLKSKNISTQINDLAGSNNYNLIPEAKITAFTANTPQYPYALKSMKSLTHETTKVIGGPHVSCKGNCNIDGFDISVIGEGESALQSIVKSNSISNLVIHGTPINNLDTLPYPDRKWDGFEKYKYKFKDYNFTTALTSRGCPYNCGFCFNMFGNRVRFMSPNRVIEEAKIISNLSYDGIMYYDDTFTLIKPRVRKISEGLSKLNMKYRCFIRANTVNKELLSTLKQTGCIEVGMGVECMHPDTYVYNSDGSFDKISSNNSNSIISIDNVLSQQNSECIKLCKNNVEFVKVITRTREITCSKEHKFLCITDNGLEWKEIKNLKKGDYIGITKKIEEKNISTKPLLSIKELLNIEQNQNTLSDYFNNEEKIKIEDTIKEPYPKLVYEIIGYFTGDGCFSDTNGIRFTDEKIDVINYFKNKVESLSIKTSIYDGSGAGKNSFDLRLWNNNILETYVKKLELQKKKIPKYIKSASYEIIYAFLRGLYEADGTININSKPVISYSSSQKTLIEELKLLLIKIGIETTIVKKYTNPYGEWYKIDIQQKNSIKKFSDNIGFISQFKKERLSNLLSRDNMIDDRSYSDAIPLTKNLWLQFLKENNTSASEIYKKYGISLNSKIYGVEDKPQRLLLNNLIKILSPKGDVSNLIKNITKSENIGWQKIVSIENGSSGIAYDYNAPLFSNYIANGFIVHNSGSPEIINTINKQITIEQCKNVINQCHKIELSIKIFLMVGLPGESIETVNQTIEFLKKTKPDNFDITILTPFPHTDIWDNKNKYDINFNKSSINYEKMFYKGVAGNYISQVSTSSLTSEEIEKLRDYIDTEIRKELYE